MADRAFDRYGRILGSTGYSYVVDKINAGIPPQAIVDGIIKQHPQFEQSQVKEYVKEGVSATQKSNELNQLIQGVNAEQDEFRRNELLDEIDLTPFEVVNSKLFGQSPEGDIWKWSADVGIGDGTSKIKVSITGSEHLTLSQIQAALVDRALEICKMYPTKFGLTTGDACPYLILFSYAPERRF